MVVEVSHWVSCEACKLDGFEDVPTLMTDEARDNGYGFTASWQKTQHWECPRGHVTVRMFAYPGHSVLVWDLGSSNHHEARAKAELERRLKDLS